MEARSACTFACEYGWPSGDLQPFGCELRFGKCVGAFDRQRTHDIARAFHDVKCNLDVAAVIDHGRSDLYAAESLRLVDGLEIVDAGAYELIAELPMRKEVFLLHGECGSRSSAFNCDSPVIRTSVTLCFFSLVTW